MQRQVEYTRKWRAANPDKTKAQGLRWREKHPEKRSNAYRSWRLRNLESCRVREEAYKRSHRAYYAALQRGRDAGQRQATPAWANKKEILRIYKEAARLGMQVDHIVPLKSNKVCGLHWEGNLQLLTPKENSAKKNYRWPGMASEAA